MSLGLCGITTGNLISEQEIEDNFADLHHPLNLLQATAEASRCLYCFDAPCVTACPTSIDIPTFIHQIRTENINGSAKTILSENIMGGTCARACPTEILCEQACVLNSATDKPVTIGLLQRFAVDTQILSSDPHPFKTKESSGKKIAIIGAGPAGLSCAHRLSMLGHESVIFEAKSKSGGLNEYGLAAYKMADDFAQKEAEFLLDIGGISIEHNKKLNQDIMLSDLQKDYDAVFIGVGLSQVRQLNIESAQDPRVINAIDFIESLRQTSDKSSIKIAKNIVVIGAGNTAIDAAIQSKRLGATNVTLVYRRGESAMSATEWEVDLARRNDIKLLFWASPYRYSVDDGQMQFKKTVFKAGNLVETDEIITVAADQVLKAIGQTFEQTLFPDLEDNKIKISEGYETSLTGVFAGGDCVATGQDLTVQAVQDGKLAAHSIDNFLSAKQTAEEKS